MRCVYSYSGAVMEFDRCLTTQWSAETTACSQAEARRNLIFQYKRQHGRAVTAKISLPDSIIMKQYA